jgi:hypothetical protein
VKLVEYDVPDLSAIDAVDDDVVHSLRKLATEDTAARVLKAMLVWLAYLFYKEWKYN